LIRRDFAMSIWASLLAAAALSGAGAVQAEDTVAQSANDDASDGSVIIEDPVAPRDEFEGSAVLMTLREVDPNLTPIVCPFRGSIEYEPGEVSCGLITAPENREVPDSRLIQLHYVKIAAWGEDESTHRDDPVIYLTGGPGVGVDTYVERLKDHNVAEHRDLYILEQRGIGASGEFCELYNNVQPALGGDVTSMEAMQIAEAERTRLCFQEARAQGIDLSGYNTVENARDVQALREALGLEEWNIWGISYGSHLGQMVLRIDPEGTRAMVIDAIVPNDLNGLFDYGRIFSQVVTNFASTCDGGAMCEDLEARLYATIDSLSETPVILQIDESEAFPGGQQWVPPAIAAYLPFSMAYEQSEHPAVPSVIQAVANFAESRDPVIIAGLEAVLAAPDDEAGFIFPGMSAAIRCNDGYVQEALDAYSKTPLGRWEGVLGTEAGSAYAAQMCVEEGLAPRDRADYALVQTDVPTLIVNGDWDPVTPPWLAEYIHEAMPGSRLIITPFAGHGPTRSMPECAGPVMTAFFDNPDVNALDATCLEEGEPRPVYQNLKWTKAPFIAAGLITNQPESFIVPSVWLGGSLVALLLGAVMIPLGFIGRLIDRTPVSVIGADTGGARLTGWLAAVTGLAGVGMIGAGAYAASEISQVAVLAGFAAPAGAGMWSVLVSGPLGVASLVFLIRAFLTGDRIRIGTLLGFAILAVAAAALTSFAFVWDLTPF
jgi:pimeloyl-ACP methyl ester carboxylesterase